MRLQASGVHYYGTGTALKNVEMVPTHGIPVGSDRLYERVTMDEAMASAHDDLSCVRRVNTTKRSRGDLEPSEPLAILILCKKRARACVDNKFVAGVRRGTEPDFGIILKGAKLERALHFFRDSGRNQGMRPGMKAHLVWCNLKMPSCVFERFLDSCDSLHFERNHSTRLSCTGTEYNTTRAEVGELCGR